MKLLSNQKYGMWLRRYNQGKLRRKTTEWYHAKENKNDPVVRKVVDLAHWDLRLDFYTLDHLVSKYVEPTEEAVTAALMECGWPKLLAATRARKDVYESRGCFRLGPTFQRQKINPLRKYLDTERTSIYRSK
jgi:hypothetical protein